jgi:hypothetical protein
MSYSESHDRMTVSHDVVLPPVQVTARDEVIGRIATGETSAEAFAGRSTSPRRFCEMMAA